VDPADKIMMLIALGIFVFTAVFAVINTKILLPRLRKKVEAEREARISGNAPLT
jgi:lipopolysaccharide export LptBFGC system permease protein LptF